MALEFEKPILELEKRIAELKETARTTGVDLEAEIRLLEERLARLKQEVYGNLTAWQRVQLARAPGRPTPWTSWRGLSRTFWNSMGTGPLPTTPPSWGG